MSSPWDLRTALAHPSAVRGGDTIWLRGGTYNGYFLSRLNGTSGAPIKVRQYPGERATLDGGNSNTNAILTVAGSHTWYWGFEVMSSDSNRTSPPIGVGEGIGIAQDSSTGAGLKFINLAVHDTASGFGFWKEAIGAEIYGCLIYYNGRILPHGPPGHAIYVQNLNGTKRIVDNIIFGQLSHGIHAFGSETAPLDNLHIEGNTVFNNGPANDYQRNLLVGGGRVAHNLTLLNNSFYYPSTAGQHLNVGYEYGNGAANVLMNGNYVVRGDNYFSPLNSNVTMTGNSFYSSGVLGVATSQFPANTYSFTNPTGVRVTVRPNAYEPGRAHITVYNWDGASSVAVNLGSVLPSGALYEIRNAQNFFGSPVASGTYNGGNVNVPLGALPNAQPVGFGAPPATGPHFNTFVVVMRGTGSPTPNPPPPTPTPTPPPPATPPPATPPPATPPPATPPPATPPPATPPSPPATPTPPPPAPPTTPPGPGVPPSNPNPTPPSGSPTPHPWLPPSYPVPPGPGPSGPTTGAITVPLAGHVTGAGGIVFVTDLHIENPTGAAGTALLSFLPAGSAQATQVTFGISAGQTVNYYDVVGLRFGIQNSVGALRLENSGSTVIPFRMTSRTYARIGSSTFGQAVSGVNWEETSESRFVTGLVISDDYRTNLGAVNTSAGPQQFEIILFDSNGRVAGVAPSLSLGAGRQMQWSLAGLFPSARGKGLTAEFRPVAGSMTPAAYGAVVDNYSGDPTYYPAIRPASIVFLPGVAHVTGLGLTTFTSDVSFANATDQPAAVRVTFLEKLRDNSVDAPTVSFVLPPRATLQVDDALGILFGRSETFGALAIECASGAVLVAERISTASLTGPGTVGQQVDPITPAQLMSHGSVLGLRQDFDFRSNVGLFNPNPHPVNVELVLKTGQGVMIAGTTITLLPTSYEQRGLAALFPGTTMPAGQSLSLVVNSGGSAIFPFGIVVDNHSQDLTFSPGLR